MKKIQLIFLFSTMVKIGISLPNNFGDLFPMNNSEDFTFSYFRQSANLIEGQSLDLFQIPFAVQSNPIQGEKTDPANGNVIRELKKKSITCIYTIQNQGSCNINVDVVFWDGSVCTSSTGITLAPGNTNFQCMACGPLTDVVVKVNWISNVIGTLSGTGIVNISNTNDGGTYLFTCNLSNTYQINWFESHTDVAF